MVQFNVKRMQYVTEGGKTVNFSGKVRHVPGEDMFRTIRREVPRKQRKGRLARVVGEIVATVEQAAA